MTEYQYCTAERDGRLLVVTVNRPEVMNAIHPPASFELERVFDDFAADPELWVAIVTGAGDRAFSAGNDLKYQAAGNEMTRPKTFFGGLTSRFNLNKPLIAAVNGVAMGAASSSPSPATSSSPRSARSSPSPSRGWGSPPSPGASSGCRGSSARSGRWA